MSQPTMTPSTVATIIREHVGSSADAVRGLAVEHDDIDDVWTWSAELIDYDDNDRPIVVGTVTVPDHWGEPMVEWC